LIIGFIIPHGVVVDSDDFNSYMIMVFCKESTLTIYIIILYSYSNIHRRRQFALLLIINIIIFFIGAVKPIVMILVKKLPISEKIKNTISKYLNKNNFDSWLHKVRHRECIYGQNIVGNEHE